VHLVIDNDREKTGVRKFVLWPETVKAIEGLRRGDDLLFVTATAIHGSTARPIQHRPAVSPAADELGIKRGGVNFGSLRHTHVSAVGDHPDLNAARLVRGHKFSGIESHYDFPDLADQGRHRPSPRKRLLTNAWIDRIEIRQRRPHVLNSIRRKRGVRRS
jgi:hypothetical protein